MVLLTEHTFPCGSPCCPLSRGDIIEQPPVALPMLNETLEEEDETITSILNPQHTLYSSGPEILLYFYSDAAMEGPGFELAYWYVQFIGTAVT